MAKNKVQHGGNINFIASADVLSGGAVLIGTLLGVAITNVKSGDTGVAAIEEVWEFKKLSTAVITAGARLTWDVSASEFIIAAAATGDLENCAVAIAAAGNGVTTVRARLSPGCGTLKA